IVRANIVGQGFVFNTEETFWRPEYGHLKRLMTVPSIWGYYLLRALFPFFLNFESGIELFNNVLRPQFIFGVISVGATAIVVFFRRKDVLFLWALFFWTIALFPVLNIFPIFESGMEHYMYLPMTAFCIYFGSFFGKVKKRILLFLLLCTVFSLTIFFRGGSWKTEANVWLDSAKKTAVYARHGWIRSRVNLASSYISIAEESDSAEMFVSKAESLYLEVKSEYPDFSSVNIGLGNIHLIRGEYDSALVYISAAVNVNPKNYFLLNKLAFIYSALGDDNTALIFLERAIQMKPDYDEANANLAVLYFIRNEFEKTREILRKTEITPRNYEVMRRLEIAFIIMDGGKIEEYDPEINGALVLLEDADLTGLKLKLHENLVFLRPADPDALLELALCAALEEGEISYALKIFDQGAEVFANDSRFLRGKGLLYISVGDTTSSISTFEEYLLKFPKDTYWFDVRKFVDSIKVQ
ncbi:hypothetical protein JXA84_05150, partial [candidate division WOR-3 bacterium]|nr:hypothetical protein [candidate division WOR-3 bacterium]